MNSIEVTRGLEFKTPDLDISVSRVLVQHIASKNTQVAMRAGRKIHHFTRNSIETMLMLKKE